MRKVIKTIHDYKFYNPEKKYEFLTQDKFAKDNVLKHAYVLQKAYDAEDNLKKDLSEFTLDEIQIMMHSWRYNSIAEKRKTIEYYIDFTNKNNKKRKENPLNKKRLISLFGKIQNYDNQLIVRKTYMSKEEILSIINECKNYQDAIVIRLLFEGLRFDEMLELTMDNVFNDYILVGNRKVDIDKECVKLIKFAYEEEEYEPHISQGLSKRGKFFYLPDSSRKVIKRVDSNKSEDSEESKEFLQRRLEKVKNSQNIKSSFNQIPIIRAGMLYKAKEILENSFKENLTINEIKKITLEFGYPTYESYISILTKEAVESTYGKISHIKKNEVNAADNQLDKESKDKHFFEFWRLKEKYGVEGEKIVRKYLEWKGFIVILQAPIVGYDFFAKKIDDERRIEVKTTTSVNGVFYMTRNEVDIAFNEQDYCIYLVIMSDIDRCICNCYKISNPINYLNIKGDWLNDDLADNNFGVTVRSASLQVFLNELFINKLEKVFRYDGTEFR